MAWLNLVINAGPYGPLRPGDIEEIALRWRMPQPPVSGLIEVGQQLVGEALEMAAGSRDCIRASVGEPRRELVRP